jgi:cyclopropane fatty-acyl-phospholipid synthase-like methyltransferase
MRDILTLERGFIAPPPKMLQERVLGLYSPDFVASGWHTFSIFEQALAGVGRDIRSAQTILDFGCGCGRVVRACSQLLPEARIFGTDIDAEAIQWLTENYQRFGKFSVNGPLPPLDFDSGWFDLIYGISVFTHLPEEMQNAWLAELNRISRPGGMVLLTIYAEQQYSLLNASNRAEFLEKGFFYVREKVPTTPGLPDFYQTSFHSHEYIRRVWSEYFEIIDIQSRVMHGHSDLVVLRRS